MLFLYDQNRQEAFSQTNLFTNEDFNHVLQGKCVTIWDSTFFSTISCLLH